MPVATPPAEVPPLAGRCQCGCVNYEVADAFLYALNCHCSQCRRATGSAFKPIGGIEADKLRLLTGADDLLVHGDADAHDVRCGQCGSFLYSIVASGSRAHVGLGSLIDTPSRRPDCHIFVGSKAPWFTITDTLPQYDGFPPPAD